LYPNVADRAAAEPNTISTAVHRLVAASVRNDDRGRRGFTI
jgi:hypothetical protein